MAEFKRPLSDEYWRPAPSTGNVLPKPGFQTQENDAYCAICGAPYAAGALFCHLCGAVRSDDLATKERTPRKERFDLEAMRRQFGFSIASLACMLAAVIFALAAVMTGLVYNTSTIAEWQAVQSWRIEWLLATVAALVAAMLFRTKPW